MSDVEASMRQMVRAANRIGGTSAPLGYFIYKGVVFASNAAADTAPKDDPTLTASQVEQVRDEVRSWFDGRAQE